MPTKTAPKTKSSAKTTADTTKTKPAKTSKSPSKKSTKANIAFELFAPYNDIVQLMGSWNKWTPMAMQKDERGYWRVEVPLADGDYEYKFQVVSKSYFMPGETAIIADPKAPEYTISRENSVARIRDGKRITISYQWQHDDVPLLPNDQLIIYELHVGDFNPGKDKRGTFNEVTERLDYLADLGITAIEIMPVNEFPWEHSWGYAQSSIFAIENTYGSPDDLARLVDEAHARGIRIIHDAVYNHMQSEAPLTRIDYSYWFYENNPDDASLQFGPKFNYEHFDDNLKVFPARQHVMDSMHFWTRQFHIDGIRFDCTRALKYFDLLQWFHDEIYKDVSFKPFYTIAEHIPQDPAIASPGGPTNAAWYDSFYRQLSATTLGVEQHGRQPFNTDEVLRVMDARNERFASPYSGVTYLSNHDEQRVTYLLGTAANTFDDAAFRRMKLGASLLLTAPGIPMIWMGEEFGQPTDKSMEPRPLQWELLKNEDNAGLHAHYRHLIRLRRENPALYSPNYQPIASWQDRGILAYKRWNDEGNVVLVVANLKDAFGGDFSIGGDYAGLEDGAWRECIHGYDVQVQGGTLTDTLAESDVKVYIKQG